MEYLNRMNAFGTGPSDAELAALIERARERAARNETAEVYKRCFAALDLTTLSVTDSALSVRGFVEKALALEAEFPQMPAPASVCVFPDFVDTVGLAAGDSGIRITSVAGGFPSSQTYLEVKMLEVAMAVENGADEIDIVMSVGEVLAGDYDVAANEIETIRQEIGEDVTLKVIIESGVLPSTGDVRKASLLAILAGADFIKTSTGKTPVSATPEAVAAMCCAILDYHNQTGRKAGIKVAGGIRTASDAVLYYSLVETILGPEWLDPSLFRIGASSLANDLISKVVERVVTHF